MTPAQDAPAFDEQKAIEDAEAMFWRGAPVP